MLENLFMMSSALIKGGCLSAQKLKLHSDGKTLVHQGANEILWGHHIGPQSF